MFSVLARGLTGCSGACVATHCLLCFRSHAPHFPGHSAARVYPSCAAFVRPLLAGWWHWCNALRCVQLPFPFLPVPWRAWRAGLLRARCY